MALPPSAVEPLQVEDPQEAEAQRQNPGGAEAGRRPVLAAVAAVILLVVAIVLFKSSGETVEVVDKDTYIKWEKNAIIKRLAFVKRYVKGGGYTPWPENAKPAFITEKQVVLAVFPVSVRAEVGKTYKTGDASEKPTGLPEKRTLDILPMGSTETKMVDFGLHDGTDGDEKVFKHIGIGMEGVLNVNQNIGEDLKTVSDAEEYSITEVKKIVDAWTALVQPNLAEWQTVKSDVQDTLENRFTNLNLVLKSVEKAFVANGYKDLKLMFVEQPTRVLVVSTAADVLKETKAYCIRTNSGDDGNFAERRSDVTDLFFALPMKTSDNGAESNYKKGNILYDCLPGP